MSEQQYTNEIEKVETLAVQEGPQKSKKSKKSVKSVKAEQVKETEEKRFTLELYPADENVTEVAIADLIPLDSTPIKGASYAMREINQKNYESILISIENGEAMPDIEVVLSNMGAIVYDGYHRWMAYEQYLKNAVSGSDAPIEQARKEFRVNVHTTTVHSERELLQLSFEANLRHGLQASEASKSRYAVWMYKNAEEDGTPISGREAARRAHISNTAFLKEMKKQAAKEQKMLDEIVGPQDKEDAETYLMDEEGEKGAKDASKGDTIMKSVIKACKWFNEQAMNNAELELFVSSWKNQVYKDEVEVLQYALASLYNQAKDEPEPTQKELVR